MEDLFEELFQEVRIRDRLLRLTLTASEVGSLNAWIGADWLAWAETAGVDSIAREGRYQQTGNPLFVWRTILEADGCSLPPWVVTYLKEGALQLLAESLSPARRGSIAQKVAEALGFKAAGKTGAGNPFRAFDHQGFQLARGVADRLGRGGKLYLAREEVAEDRGVSEKTVRRAWATWHWFWSVVDTKSGTSRLTQL